LRKYTAVLSGTFGPAGPLISTFLGVSFLITYFVAVLIVPALLIGSAISWGWWRGSSRKAK
jgi:hypothetical protein